MVIDLVRLRSVGAARSAGRHRSLLRVALGVFFLVVMGHWVEHVMQAVQVWWLGWPRPEAGGALGLAAPDLASSELLHLVYNGGLLVISAALLPHFAGRARRWWLVTLVAQGWHAAEHVLLWIQAETGARPFGTADPASVGQLLVPRIELHLAYNGVITALIVVALFTAGSVLRLRTAVQRPTHNEREHAS